MKFSATKEKLLEGLQQVQNVVSTRTTLPILSNVLLQAKEGAVHLPTTDLNVGVRGSFEANVDKVGATTLPARRLFTIIRELPSSEIAIEVENKGQPAMPYACGLHPGFRWPFADGPRDPALREGTNNGQSR